MKTNSKGKRAAAALLYALIFIFCVLFFLLNRYTPISFKDDISYCFSYATGELITSPQQILESQIAHYKVQNGRFIVHTIDQLLLLYGKQVFNIVNTFVFLLFCMLVTYHVVGEKLKNHLTMLVCVFCAVFLVTPCFAEDLLWVSGSCNYLFGFTICLIYLIPYRAALSSENSSKKKKSGIIPETLKAFAMLILGIIAGNTMENAGIALIVTVMVYIAFYWMKGFKLHFWMFMPGPILGLLSLLLASGEAERMAAIGAFSLSSILSASVRTCIALVVHYYPLIFILISVVYLYWLQQVRNSGKKISEHMINWEIPVIYSLGAAAATFSMVVVPGGLDMYSRIWFGPQTFFLIVLGSSLMLVQNGLINLNNDILKLKNMLVCFLTFASIIVAIQGLWNVRNRFYENESRFQAAKEQLAKGEEIIKLPALSSISRFSIYFSGGEHLYYDSSRNALIAKYYEMPEIVRDDSLIIP